MTNETKAKLLRLAADITSALTVLAALPYTLGDIASIMSPEAKKYVAGIGLGATIALRLISAFTKPVTDIGRA